MTIELTGEVQSIIDRAMRTGLYNKPEEVVFEALRSLAEDWDDLSTIAERAADPRISLAGMEAELRAEGLLS